MSDYGFNTNYWNSMDRPMYDQNSIDPGRLGITAAPMKNQLSELYAKVKAGAKRVELGFWNSPGEKTGSNSPGVESYGAPERTALKELAKVTGTQLSTHATISLHGKLAGLNKDGASGEAGRETSIREINQTVDFAADIAEGGPVVVHISEPLPKIISETPGGKFKAYEDEEKNAPVIAIDKETGDLVKKPFQKGSLISISAPNKKPEITTYAEYEKNPGKFLPHLQGKQLTPSEIKIEYFKNELDSQIKDSQVEAYRLRSFSNAAAPNSEEKKIYEDKIDRIKSIIPILEKQKENVISYEDYYKEKIIDTLSKSALHAHEVTKAKNLKNPVFIAPENIYPEQYGGSPDELKEVVVNTRKKVAEKLIERGYNPHQAEKAAADHVKATFDVGHAYTWKKYFQGDKKEFDNWLLDKVKDLTKSGIIGHVHVTDNFGYTDEHLSIGEGEVPFNEFAQTLKKEGYEGTMILEVGSKNERTLRQDALRAIGSPIYRIDGATKTWTDIQGSYFGQTYSPSFIVKPHTPDEKVWSFWSGVPME